MAYPHPNLELRPLGNTGLKASALELPRSGESSALSPNTTPSPLSAKPFASASISSTPLHHDNVRCYSTKGILGGHCLRRC